MNIWEIRPKQTTIAIELGEELDCQLVEEMAELTQALMTERRCEGKGQPTNKRAEDVEASINEELTDVIICLKEYMWLHNIDEAVLLSIEEKKLERTRERLGIKEVEP